MYVVPNNEYRTEYLYIPCRLTKEETIIGKVYEWFMNFCCIQDKNLLLHAWKFPCRGRQNINGHHYVGQLFHPVELYYLGFFILFYSLYSHPTKFDDLVCYAPFSLLNFHKKVRHLPKINDSEAYKSTTSSKTIS